MVPTDSHRISRVRCYLGDSRQGPDSIPDFTYAYGAITLYGLSFQTYSASVKLPGCRATAPADYSRYTLQATPVGLTPVGFGLTSVRSPLLRGSLLLSFPRVTKMFQFTRLPPSALFCSGGGDAA